MRIATALAVSYSNPWRPRPTRRKPPRILSNPPGTSDEIQRVQEARLTSLVEVLLLDGSFISEKPAPNDIDIVVVVFAAHDFSADLSPQRYNVLAKQRVRRRFGLDIVVVKNGTDNLAQAVAFFSQIRQQPEAKKGLLRLTL